MKPKRISEKCHNAVKGNTASKALEIEVIENIAILRLNREEALNALTVELARGLVAGLIELDRRDDVRGIVLTGAGDGRFARGSTCARRRACR